MRLNVSVVTLVAMLALGWASAQQRVGRVLIEGCKIAKPEAVLEAAGIGEGVEFDEQKFRQALLDLGIFSSVTINTETLPDNTVAVVITVSEKELPTPKTAAAAKVLDLKVLAQKCWEKEANDLGASGYLTGSLSFSFKVSVGFPEWQPTSKATWVKKFSQWSLSSDKRLKEPLRKELENFLRRHPKDVEARLALALLMAETDDIEQLKRALSEFQSLLTHHPNLHWAHPLRLSALLSRPFFLPIKVPESSEHVSVSVKGELSEIKVEPGEMNWLRGELVLAIEEGERHLRALHSNRWDREAIKAAARFFQDATGANLFLTMVKSIEEVAEQFGEEFVPAEGLAEPITRYFNDFLRISQIAQRFPNDAEVQLAMAMWGQSMVGSLFMTALSTIVGTFGEDESNERNLSDFGKMLLAQRNLYKPVLERLVWHLQRVTALDKKWASTAFAFLALCHGVLGDFNAARRVVENGLNQPQPDGKTLASVINNLAFLEAAVAAANRPKEEKAISTAIIQRYTEWVNRLRTKHLNAPELTFLWVVLRLSEYRKKGQWGEPSKWEWDFVPETVRKEVLNALQNAANRNPRSDFAQRIFGLTLLLEGEVRQALPYLLRARELNPNWFSSRYALALGYLMARETEKALPLFQKNS